MMKSKKGDLQMPFAWIFAIIVGAIILFLAIFAATKLIKTGEAATGARTGKEISALLNPLETGSEEGAVVHLNMPVETRIHNGCSQTNTFGRQTIEISQKSFNQWTDTDLEQGFTNKYIFSNGFSEGKNFIIFAKPFDMPFKVSDLIYLVPTADKYCFSNAPSRVKSELSDLDQENIFVEEDACEEGTIKVCFGSSSGCDINVNEFQKSVSKTGEESIVYYETDSLMYAAIFSDSAVYECHVKRLMYRLESLIDLYEGKQAILMSKDCPNRVNLQSLKLSANSLSKSSDLISVVQDATQANVQNNLAGECKLW